jgi:hypothetical protein
MVEIWFWLMTRKAVNGSSFKSHEGLIQAINDFISVYKAVAGLFVWRKRENKASQLKKVLSKIYTVKH